MGKLMHEPGSRRLVEVVDVSKSFLARRRLGGQRETVVAVAGVSISMKRGETVGLLGESGSGKTTIGRMLLKLTEPSSGRISFDGASLEDLGGAALKEFRRRAQLIFQNPFDAFNPRFTLRRSLSEPLLVAGIDRRDHAACVENALELAGFRNGRTLIERYPHELSGGQLQRCVIARAMMLDPDFIVADEPVSMLDVSIRAGILNLLRDLQQRRQLTALYISHDITLVRYLCERTLVMHRGRIVEEGPTEQIIKDPQHPYTRELIAAVPRRRVVAG